MRAVDADELKKCAIPCEIHNGALTDLCVPLYQINSAPTVELNQDLTKNNQGSNKGDLISREALKKHKFTTQIANGVEIEDIEVVPLDIIDNAPTVEEKSYAMGYQDGLEDGLQDIREQGEWLKCEVGLFKCSICGRHICTSISNDSPYIDYPFCHCGAEMKGGTE